MDELAPSQPYRAPLGPILKVRNAPKLSGQPIARFVLNCWEIHLSPPYILMITLYYIFRAQGMVPLNKLHKMKFEIPAPMLRFLNHGFKPHENMSDGEKRALDTVR